MSHPVRQIQMLSPDFSMLFQATPGCLLALMPDAPRFTVVAASDDYLKTVGARRESIVGRGFFEVFSSDAGHSSAAEADARASLERVINNRQPDQHTLRGREVRSPADDGCIDTRCWTALNTPVFDDAGQLRYIIHRIEEITLQNCADAAMAAGSRRIELLANTASELLRSPEPQKVVESLCRQVMDHLDCHAFFNFLVDRDADKLRLNACAGIPAEEARRIEWLDYGVAVCGCAARDGCRIVAEHIPTTPDPRTELVKGYGIKAYACHPLLGPGGQVIGTLSFGTRSRETFSDDDLSLMKAVTDHVAVAMVRQHAEESLRRAKQAAETASRAKDEFIAVLSHELRTPLTPVFAAVSLLQRDRRLPPDVRDDLDMMHRNLELEVRLIADLLDVSRIIAGKLHLEKRLVDVADTIREAAKIVQSDLIAKNQTLSIEPMFATYLTLGDPARLQQVFWNLIRNSIKFSPNYGHITVRARVLDAERCPLAAQPCPAGQKGPCPHPPQAGDADPSLPKQNLVIEVIDHGEGIAADLLPRLFNAFEQDRNGRQFGGLGLGLSICKGIVEMHGGQISAYSEGRGRGSIFTVRLPVAHCPLTAEKTPAKFVTASAQPAQDSSVAGQAGESHQRGWSTAKNH